MKIKFLWAFPLLLWANAGYGYEPLLGSHWAQEHPGLLPYSKCRVRVINNYSFALLGGADLYPGQHTLHCTTLPLASAPDGLEYAIPIGKISGWSTGVNAYAGWGAPGPENYIAFTGLNGKSPADLPGKYKGYAVGAGALYGWVAYSRVWKKGISLKDLELGMGLGAGVTYTTRKIKPQKHLSLHECEDNMLILGDTTRRRTPEECLDMALPAGEESDFSAFRERQIPFAMSQLSALVFKKVPI